MPKKALITIAKFACLTGAYMASALAVAAVYARDGGMTFADLSAGVSSPILSRLLAVFSVVFRVWQLHPDIFRLVRR